MWLRPGYGFNNVYKYNTGKNVVVPAMNGFDPSPV
jgi:hypothetical protein